MMVKAPPMTEISLSRRRFLGGALSTVVISSIPFSTKAEAHLPRIVGDGIHDDTAGILAAMNGQPFICDGDIVTVKGGTIHFGAGRFRVRPMDFSASSVIPASNLKPIAKQGFQL